MAEAHTRGKLNDPDFLSFKPEMKTTISNSSSHLSLSSFWEKNEYILPLQLFSWVEKSCCYSIHGENSLLFWVEGITVLSCLSILLMVSMILDWKHLDCYFFPGSNLDIQSFLSTEGKNLANSRQWWGLVTVPGHSWNWQLAWRSEMNAQWQQVGTKQIHCQLWKSIHS